MDELDGLEDEGGGRGEVVDRHGQEEKKECSQKRVITVKNNILGILIISSCITVSATN